MSDNLKRMLLMGAGAMLTMAIIILYITSFRRVSDVTTELQEQELREQQTIELYPITRYDQCTIYGSQVINYLKTNFSFFDKVSIDSGDGNGPKPITDTDNFRTAGHDAYIYGNGLYFVSLVYNKNNVPTEVIITKQGP